MRLHADWIVRTFVALLVAVCMSAASAPAAAEPPAAGLEQFEKHVRPLLVKHCLECHGPQGEGGLRLDSQAAMTAGGDSGPAIVVGDPNASLLVRAVRYDNDELQMPPDGKLPDEAVATFTEWIRLGAPWPDEAAIPADDQRASAWKSHWAFQPLAAPPVPQVERADWPQTSLDDFVLSRLEEQGLSPSPPADRRALIRRASYDLTGLPPTADEVESFVGDPDPHAFDRLVERLLASPHYGERWARHWLDVARYADTKGYVFQEDRNYPNAYRYRDWVVRAFNEDMPYDQFLIAQIAADRLPGDDPGRLAALGFLTVGRRFLNNRHDIIDDRIDVLTRGTMALTVTCARCHDHKYDPIPTADYYSLYGVFASSVEPKEPAEYMTLADAENPIEPHVFLRGNSGNPGPRVPRQFLGLLAGEDRQPFADGSGRLELARAIAAGDNPLTARVIVNRVWMQYFGKPLVETPSDFGLRSDPPTHPELLDHLAASLVADGWSLKNLARTILRSAAYQQASLDRPDCRQVDPENRLLWRANRKRLDFEGLRDALLAASGQLDPSLGGPAVELTTLPSPRRRTLYGLVNRQNLPNLFRTFDFASPDTHSPGRFETSVPQQALYMMNSPFLGDQVRALAARAAHGHDQPADQIAQLYRIVLKRAPRPEELELGLRFLDDERAHQPIAPSPPAETAPTETEVAKASEVAPATGTPATPAEQAPDEPSKPKTADQKKPRNEAPPAGPPLTPWQRYVQVVLISNEFVYVD